MSGSIRASAGSVCLLAARCGADCLSVCVLGMCVASLCLGLPDNALAGSEPLPVVALYENSREERQLALTLPEGLTGKTPYTPDNPPLTVTLYLNLVLNNQPTALVVPFEQRATDFMIRSEDLLNIGINIQKLNIQSGEAISLDQIAGLRYEYNEAAQQMRLTVPPDLMQEQEIEIRPPARYIAPQKATGLILDYDAYVLTRSDIPLSLYTQQRWFQDNDTAENTGLLYVHNDSRQSGNQNQRRGQGHLRYIRYESRWSRSWPETQHRLLLGDTISSSQSWSRSVRMAGIQFGRDFGIRPDLLTYPVASIKGSSVVPSAIDLFVNGVRQYSGQTGSGPFIINQISGITGAGMATVVTRDVQGREIPVRLPLYIDTRMLAADYSTYSLEAGLIRRQYGVNSADYDPRPVAMASSRHGVTDILTLETHGEAGRGLIMGGFGGLVRLGTVGVVNAAVSGSSGRSSGVQIAAGFQSVQQTFTIDVQTIRAVRRFADLAVSDDAPVPRVTDRISLGIPMRNGQSFAASLIQYRTPNVQSSRLAALSYSLATMGRLSVNMSAYKDLINSATKGISLTLSYSFDGGRSASLSSGRQDGGSSYAFNASQSAPYEGGVGWNLQAGRTSAIDYVQAQTSLTGRYGEVTGGMERYGKTAQFFADFRGSLIVMSGQTMLARQTTDGFALVSTHGYSDIPVQLENRLAGKTDRYGYLLVTGLNAYQRNHISVDTSSLAADVETGFPHQYAVPGRRAGVDINFKMRPFRAASVALVDEHKQPLPPGLRVQIAGADDMIDEASSSTIVGYDGIIFINGLLPANRILVRLPDGFCEARFAFAGIAGGRLAQIGPVPCRRVVRAASTGGLKNGH